jgi:hypothetical protein
MGPVTYTPHNLDTAGSTGGRSMFPLTTVVNAESMFESSANIMESFAMWVT